MFIKRTIDRSMFYNASPEIFERAKELRENMTPAENVLWAELNRRKIKGYRFKPQHPINRFIVDFYCHKAKVVIEIDGEVHELEEQVQRDQGRSSELEAFGLKVLRFSNQDVFENLEEVVKKINNSLQTPEGK